MSFKGFPIHKCKDWWGSFKSLQSVKLQMYNLWRTAKKNGRWAAQRGSALMADTYFSYPSSDRRYYPGTIIFPSNSYKENYVIGGEKCSGLWDRYTA